MNDEAARTLGEIQELRRATRQQLDGAWFPFILWGILLLGSAPVTQIGSGDWTGIYWAVAAPTGIATTSWFFHSRELTVGLVWRHSWAYLAIAIAMGLGAFALGAAGGGGMLSAVGPAFAVAAGLLAFAVLARAPLTAVIGTAIAAVATVVLLADPAEPTLLAALGQGTVLAAAGLGVLAQRRPWAFKEGITRT
jgi:hypothetical protein